MVLKQMPENPDGSIDLNGKKLYPWDVLLFGDWNVIYAETLEQAETQAREIEESSDF